MFLKCTRSKKKKIICFIKTNLVTLPFFVLYYFDFNKILLESLCEFNEFEPRLKSVKNWFQLSAGLNLEKLNTILSETNHI